METKSSKETAIGGCKKHDPHRILAEQLTKLSHDVTQNIKNIPTGPMDRAKDISTQNILEIVASLQSSIRRYKEKNMS